LPNLRSGKIVSLINLSSSVKINLQGVLSITISEINFELNFKLTKSEIATLKGSTEELLLHINKSKNAELKY
jgi:hypothetical protein